MTRYGEKPDSCQIMNVMWTQPKTNRCMGMSINPLFRKDACSKQLLMTYTCVLGSRMKPRTLVRAKSTAAWYWKQCDIDQACGQDDLKITCVPKTLTNQVTVMNTLKAFNWVEARSINSYFEGFLMFECRRALNIFRGAEPTVLAKWNEILVKFSYYFGVHIRLFLGTQADFRTQKTFDRLVTCASYISHVIGQSEPS